MIILIVPATMLCSCFYARLITFFFFFFNDTATTEIYTLSLHDALPIFDRQALHEVQAAVDTAEHPVVGVAIELAVRGVAERIAVVPQADGLAGGEVPVDVVDRDDRLHQDILAQNVVFAEVIVRNSAEGL